MVQNKTVQTPIYVITGPTCSGKSGLSITLAQKINAEIINCDSMQIYKYMDIGTAKPDLAERRGFTHHMLNIVPPDCDYSVSLYRDGADKAMEIISTAGRNIIATGGTGLYIKALLYHNTFGSAAKDDNIRSEYTALLESRGKEYLYSLLFNADPVAAKNLHMNDTKRVIRALEIIKISGKLKSSQIKDDESLQAPRVPHKLFVLNPSRENLYKNINVRVDEMIKRGLIEEVEGLLKRGYNEGLNSMKAIGYAETIKYLKNEIDKATAVELIKQNTRRYAKRQITFFKGLKNAKWLDIDSLGENGCIQQIL